MNTYIALINLTDQGIKEVNKTLFFALSRNRRCPTT